MPLNIASEDRWDWHVLEDSEDVELLLYRPRVSDIDTLRRATKNFKSVGAMKDYIAVNWFKDFKGVTVDGAPAENTENIRKIILGEPHIFKFVCDVLVGDSEGGYQGNFGEPSV